MANRAERRRAMKTTELREQAIEALGQTPYIDLEGDNEVVVRIWHPLLVDDATQVRIDYFNAGEGLDKDEDGEIKVPHRVNGKLAEPASIRSAKAILGEEEYERFVENGGRANDVQLAWNEMIRQHEDADNVLSTEAIADPKLDALSDS